MQPWERSQPSLVNRWDQYDLREAADATLYLMGQLPAYSCGDEGLPTGCVFTCYILGERGGKGSGRGFPACLSTDRDTGAQFEIPTG